MKEDELYKFTSIITPTLTYACKTWKGQNILNKNNDTVFDPIWGDEWPHSLYYTSLSWGFPGFFPAVRQMLGDLYTALGIISLSPLSLTDGRGIRGKWPLARKQDRSWWQFHRRLKLSWLQPVIQWTKGHNTFDSEPLLKNFGNITV